MFKGGKFRYFIGKQKSNCLKLPNRSNFENFKHKDKHFSITFYTKMKNIITFLITTSNSPKFKGIRIEGVPKANSKLVPQAIIGNHKYSILKEKKILNIHDFNKTLLKKSMLSKIQNIKEDGFELQYADQNFTKLYDESIDGELQLNEDIDFDNLEK